MLSVGAGTKGYNVESALHIKWPDSPEAGVTQEGDWGKWTLSSGHPKELAVVGPSKFY